MSVAEFVAAAERADPSLKGEGKIESAIQKLNGEVEALARDIPSLDKRLAPMTFLNANAPSSADVGLYCHLHPTLVSTPASSHPNHPSVTRYFLHIQSIDSVRAAQSSLPNSFPPLDIDISSLAPPPRQVIDAAKEKKEKKEIKEKEKAAAGGVADAASGLLAQASNAASSAVGAVQNAAAAAVGAVASATGLDSGAGATTATATEGGEAAKGKKEKKEKKEKAPKPPAAPKAEPTGPLPSMIDLRVGKVLDVKKHPDAESLYVESIDVGEAEPRTVCSGLVKYMSEDQIRGATVIVVCNLKPVTMRGVKSFAMLLCASSADGKDEGGIEFVVPPQGSVAGERVYFEGEKYENVTPEALLNPKKKVFETIQPGFTTLDNLDAAWIDPETKSVHLIRTKDGACRAPTLKGASLS